MVKFLAWLDISVLAGGITEMSAAIELDRLRKRCKEYRGMSFHTISAFGAHGAIVHYNVSEASNCRIAPSGIYLIDSGGHYTGGTTDITRTIAIGIPTDEQKNRYTLVLKGHIALARAIFPKGTKGVQLDLLARKPLWDKGLDYGHGTGHGVGFYLNVHEGPHSISPSKLASPGLEPGMFVTDEPGFYKEDEYGIRIENMLLVVHERRFPESDVPFYRFETLTLCPYEQRLIEKSLLTKEEVDYIDSYHNEIYRRLSPCIEADATLNWLVHATKPLKEKD
jgi:Xaa-Pro aminopeptidase